MAGTRLSHLQITDATEWRGLTTENHLGAMWKIAPQQIQGIIDLSLSKAYGNNLDSILAQFPSLSFDTDDDFEWDLTSQALDNVPLIECRIAGTAIVATDEPGKNFTEFELVFPKAYFSETELIVGERNEEYPILVQKGPIPDGSNYVYTCSLNTGDTNLFLPYDEAVAGKLFSGEYSPVERGKSRKGREIRFKTMFKMRNGFTILRMQHEMLSNMDQRKVGIVMRDAKGKEVKSWIQYEMMKFQEEFRNDINRCYMYGRSNVASDKTYKVRGISGEVIRTGSGIREQMETANTSYYNNFSITSFSRRLMDLSEGKLSSDQRNFVARTGERGAFEFHKSLESNTQLYTLNQTTDRLYKIGKQGIKMGMGYGGQFVEYTGPNNQVISISIDSMNDERNRNKMVHPLGGVVESYRFDIMDFGTNDGAPNIQKATVKDWTRVHKYIDGLWSPFEPKGSFSSVHSAVPAWEEHLYDKVAAVIRDPSRTMSYKPNLLAV